MEAPGLAAGMNERFEEYMQTLRALVDIDSGTYTVEGVNRVADHCEERFRSGGWSVDRHAHVPNDGEPQLGDLVIGTIDGGAPGPAILMIGHTDTVFPEGTAAERPMRVDGDRAFGPGVCDMKSGLLAGFFAVEALVSTGDLPGRVTYVCNPDEEIGSPFSKPFIQKLAGDSDAALVLEPGRTNGRLVTARKGVTDMRIDITGRSAHAGVEPERGASAVLEAAHKVLALHELNGRWPGVTVNAGVLNGGTRPNVVAERCEIHVDIRAPELGALEEARIEAIRIGETNTVADTTSMVRLFENHLPMEKTEGTIRLLELAQEIAEELGFEIRDLATGGASDANTTAAAGVPTLDGLGPIGGDAHSPAEWLDLTSVVPRVALLAGMIARSGAAVGGPR
ncbi:MAG: M20 family metallopeptidase [Actinomycetota bacterium]